MYLLVQFQSLCPENFKSTENEESWAILTCDQNAIELPG